MTRNPRLVAAAWLLVVTQVVHGAVPADTESDAVVGFYAGIALLMASGFALVGVMRNERWGARLLGWTGLIVAVGFVLYHAIPVETPFSNPYPGEPVGVPAWLSVIASVAAAAWAAVEARSAGAFERPARGVSAA